MSKYNKSIRVWRKVSAISKCPDEMLTNIFEFLDKDELCIVPLTCKRFYLLSQPILVNRMDYTLRIGREKCLFDDFDDYDELYHDEEYPWPMVVNPFKGISEIKVMSGIKQLHIFEHIPKHVEILFPESLEELILHGDDGRYWGVLPSWITVNVTRYGYSYNLYFDTNESKLVMCNSYLVPKHLKRIE